MNWEPLTTTNVLTIVQIIVVAIGFFWAAKNVRIASESLKVSAANAKISAENSATASESLKVSAANAKIAAASAQAQLFNQMVLQGRDLMYKQMDLAFGPKDSPDRADRLDSFYGMVLSYYSSCFEMRGVLSMPDSVTKLQDAELIGLMNERQEIRDKWAEISGKSFSSSFIRHVESLRGIR